MNKKLHVVIVSCSLFLCANFSSQDSTTSGGVKPTVNFYGPITDTSNKTFNSINITLERMYKQIPVYQEPPKGSPESYDPTINITRLDLSEIKKIEFPENQMIQKYRNRDYLMMSVYSNDAKQTQNNYIIEADKKLICDEKNDAGPIEKEIKFRAVRTITIEGFKQSDDLDAKRKANASKNTETATKTTLSKKAEPKKTRLLSYFRDIFKFHKTI